jgi:hypothetical protein
MAASSTSGTIAINTFEGNLSNTQDSVACDLCVLMKAELVNVKQELNSFKEIVKVLQEELHQLNHSSQPASCIESDHNTEEKSQPDPVGNNWTTSSSNKRNKHRPTINDHRQIPTLTSNKFAALTNLQIDHVFSDSIPQEKNHKKNRCSGQRRKTTNEVNHKILVVGDSHCRGIAAELNHCLGSTHKVTSCVQPGAGMETILNSLQNDMKSLKPNDTLVIWGGSIDIGKNNANMALTHLNNFIASNQQINTIVVTAPHRHDLIDASCVNDEVANFNWKLVKIMLPFKNVKILAANLERKKFTKHGNHLNAAGKEQAALGLSKVVKSFRKSSRIPPTSLCSKSDIMSSETALDPNVNASTSLVDAPIRDKIENESQPDQGHQASPTTSCNIPEYQSPNCKNDDGLKSGNEAANRTNDDPQDPQEEEATRKSNRNKKPTNKYQDFLCQTQSINYTL